MSTAHIRSAECPLCQRHISLLRDGTFRQHGPKSDQCLGTYRTPESAATLILPPLNEDQLAMMSECWRIGDWRPIELEFGIVCPQYNLQGRTPEEELGELIGGVRQWISTLVELAHSHAARRVP
ncbi:hypothetical protein [Mycobacterium sp.]|uniref:hypothetical protein n=1 Tax=Mycobacterium sp. TaxID=1785 RepID=UPI003F98BD2B